MKKKEIIERNKMLRLGEERVMNNGLKAKIVAYRRSGDIDLLFENGSTRTSVTYYNFVHGRVSCPSRKELFEQLKYERLGLEKKMNCGYTAKIIEYRRSDDIDVMFETGRVRSHVTYSSFLTGGLLYKARTNKRSERQKKERLGEERVMKNGSVGEIIEYRNAKNVTVWFAKENIQKTTTYANFQKGEILPAGQCGQKRLACERLGQSMEMKCGLTATITGYESSSNMEVTFSNGKVRDGISYSAFKTGRVYPKRMRRANTPHTRKIQEGCAVTGSDETESSIFQPATEEEFKELFGYGECDLMSILETATELSFV